MVRILFENPGWKCRGKNILLVCVHFPHAGEYAKALCVIYFFLWGMLFCRMIRYWFIYSCGKVKGITQVTLLLCLVSTVEKFGHLGMQAWIGYCLHAWLKQASFAYCVILRTCNFVWTNSQAFWRYLKLWFPPKLFARNKTFAAPNGEFKQFGGFALTVYTTRCKKE